MYHYLLGITFLKSLSPYFRKYILNILESHELLFINTFFISIIVFLVFIYKWLFDKEFHKTIENYQKMSIGHYSCSFFIALFTVFSTLFIYDFDKNYNTPFLNSMFIKVASVFFLFLAGVFLFEEQYTVKQIFGILLAIFGVYLVTSK
jgi:drug/metabolite transporter (DMT)-like permease